MKEGYIIDGGSIPTPEDLEKINKFTRREMKPEELFVFSVVLCDNEIDRDFERFSTEALKKMAPMFVGKTGIFDHSAKAQDQVARIFDCEAEMVEGSLTKRGEPYCRLKARVYTLNCESNKDFLLSVDGGITKEVSVGCSMGNAYCSVCAADKRSGHCEHKKGKFYRKNGKKLLCHTILDNPLDAYEWSFVAVPAQPKAGVCKSHFGKDPTFNADEDLARCIKNYTDSDQVVLSPSQIYELAEILTRLEKEAESGAQYKRNLKQEITRLGGIIYPDMETDFFQKALSDLSVEQLIETRNNFIRQADAIIPTSFQLEINKEDVKTPQHQNYYI